MELHIAANISDDSEIQSCTIRKFLNDQVNYDYLKLRLFYLKDVGFLFL